MYIKKETKVKRKKNKVLQNFWSTTYLFIYTLKSKLSGFAEDKGKYEGAFVFDVFEVIYFTEGSNKYQKTEAQKLCRSKWQECDEITEIIMVRTYKIWQAKTFHTDNKLVETRTCVDLTII